MSKKRCFNNEAEDNCPICFQEIKETNFTVTPCGHKFCMTCITKEIFIKDKCPLCRSSFQIQYKKKKIENAIITDVVCNELHLFPYIQMQKDIFDVLNVDWSNIPNSKKGLINAKVHEYMIGYGTNVALCISNIDDT